MKTMITAGRTNIKDRKYSYVKKYQLKVDTAKGLDDETVVRSRKEFGQNILLKTKKKSFMSKFISNLNDPIIRVLIIAMAINIAFSFNNINVPETVGIGMAVLIAAFVSTLSEHGSEKAFEKLNEKTGKRSVSVLRNSKYIKIHETETVVGDIIRVEAGDLIPADCKLISGEIIVDQSPLTGESKNVRKKAQNNLRIVTASMSDDHVSSDSIYKGCLCLKGECEAVVCRVGKETVYGKIASELNKEDTKSPLKARLTELARTVSKLGYAAAALIMIAYLFNSFIIDSGWKNDIILIRLKDFSFVLSHLINAITLGVSVIVVAVPEGLPMMITVVLSSNMKRMLKCGVLVRKMVGIETAGSMNVLFTDKTGTLTEGNMSVNRIIFPDRDFNNLTEITKDKHRSICIPLLGEYLLGSGNRSATERALSKFFKMTAVNKLKTKAELMEKLKFDHTYKYSACLFRSNGNNKCAILGAAELLIDKSTRYVNECGKILMMDKETRNRLNKTVLSESESKSRLLTLAFAEEPEWNNICSGNVNELIFYALISVKDELRRDIASSVKEAKRAGVHVIMITGDNKETAAAVAKEAMIYDDKRNIIMTGNEMSHLEDEELIKILPQICVVSRALPSDKLRLVEASQKAGLVCGMTGDGINDAPALKRSDVGFAMGSGTDVAKEASDIILTNNSFSSIVKAILYGRCIFESIRKFISFQLTMNLCALGVSLIGPFIGIDSPITVIQMLWVNIIMDTLGGIAFAGEVPLKEYMRRKPVNRSEKILNNKMIDQIIFCGIYTLTICIVFLKADFISGLFAYNSNLYFLTCFFALFIFAGIFNSINARAPKGRILNNLSGNKAFIIIILSVCIIQLAIIYMGGNVFRCTPIRIRDLSICALTAFTVIPADQMRKKIERLFHNKK